LAGVNQAEKDRR